MTQTTQPTQRRHSLMERWRGCGDTGSMSLELVIVAPALLLLAIGIVTAGRVASAHQAVQLAASQAARATALAPNVGAAVTAGRNQAASSVTALGQPCSELGTDVAAGGLTRAPGTATTVTVTVNCHVLLSQLVVPGLPGTLRITEAATEPVDRWLAR
jgi:Flp pilus assembly protein TadG